MVQIQVYFYFVFPGAALDIKDSTLQEFIKTCLLLTIMKTKTNEQNPLQNLGGFAAGGSFLLGLNFSLLPLPSLFIDLSKLKDVFSVFLSSA